jgi:glycosyltransferase involved in cell wall biosynthesis
MTPPVFAPLVVWLYCATHRCALVIDAHTAAFLQPRWRYFQRLQFWLCRRARTTIVHHEHFRTLIESRGGRATVVPDIPVRFQAMEAYPLPPGFNIAVVCSFNPDEPTANVLAAARRLPDVQFHVTGSPKALRGDLKAQLPPNVRLTGFLSTGAYASLISHADAVMTLTTRDHTMLRGAWEAIYQETPVIISNWNVLREAFDAGAVHVDNTPEDIVRAVETLRRDYAVFREGARTLRQRKEQRWLRTRTELQALVT